MNQITVVDARMGRGKSSAAIRYMNEHKSEKRFLYITPFLTEVDRICEYCDFDQPDDESYSKSSKLKFYLRYGQNIAASHSLFNLIDEEAVELIRKKNYTLILDESISAIRKIQACKREVEVVQNEFATLDEEGRVTWDDPEFFGALATYRDIAMTGSLYIRDSALLQVLNPAIIRSFEDVFMLTYLFDGQYQKGYLEYFGFDYRIVGIETDEKGYKFSDKPDCPPPIDYSKLINILDSKNMNSIGDSRTALSKAWYLRRGKNHSDIKKLRSNLDNYFHRLTESTSNSRMWTCFIDHRDKLLYESGRYRQNFLQIASRATNEFRDKRDLAYMANRFADPNLTKFFGARGIKIDPDKFALGEMLQWIWRSAIRDEKPINIYIPSKRMRTLLLNWIEEMKQGGTNE